jgi:TctA family transporter
MGSRWLWIASGVLVFLYCTANDLFPAAQTWLSWALVAVVLVLFFGTRTRVGSSLLGRQVAVSSRSLRLTVRWKLLRIALVLGVGIAVGLIILRLHLPHGQIYYGALAGLYTIFLGPRFQLWLLRRQDKD